MTQIPFNPEDDMVFRTSFTSAVASGVDPEFFNVICQGSGMDISQSSGNLVVTTGTTANSETIIRSNTVFGGSLILREAMMLSQRIANSNFVIALTDVIGDNFAMKINSATSITVNVPSHGFTTANIGQYMYVGNVNGVASTIPGRYAIASIPTTDTINFTVSSWPASGAGTCSLFGWNYHRILYTGTTATSALIDSCRNGWNTGDGAITINTTASPGHIGACSVEEGIVSWLDALAASSTTQQLTLRGNRQLNIPDRDVPLWLQIRVTNGSTAPASTTTMTLRAITIERYKHNPVSISGVRPQGFNSALPVQFASTPSITVTSISSGTSLIGDVGMQVRATAGGVATFARLLSAAATVNSTLVKASAGRIYKIIGYNASTSVRYLKIYNKATAPTVGTDTPVLTFALGPSALFNLDFEDVGIYLATGIGFGTTTGSADADTTALTAADIVGLNILYA